MHSRIYQMATAFIPENEFVKEDDFVNNFVGNVADYIDEDTNREEDIAWLIEYIDNFGIEYDKEKQTIIFKEGFKKNYFKERFEKFQQKVYSMKLEEFAGSSLEVYSLKELIDDKFGFYVYIDETMTLDFFVRHLEEGIKYYIGATIDYHC